MLKDVKYMSRKEAASRYCVSTKWLERAAWQGDSPPFAKLGSKCLYPVEICDLWFEARMKTFGDTPLSNDPNFEGGEK